MLDKKLLLELLEAEYEDDVIALLLKRGLFDETNSKRWIALGNMPNNQSVVHAQQSNPAAALVEKFTNGIDAILLRRCKAQGIKPRSLGAPQSMSKAVEKWFGDLSGKSQQEIRTLQGTALQHLRRAIQKARRISTAANAAAPDSRVPSGIQSQRHGRDSLGPLLRMGRARQA